MIVPVQRTKLLALASSATRGGINGIHEPYIVKIRSDHLDRQQVRHRRGVL